MENCSSSNLIDSWAFLPSPALFPESSWMMEAFTRDNQALTKALQISLSDDSSASAPPLPDTPSSSSSAAKPLLSNSSLAIRRGGGKAATKRKSRASKRSPTTYITADPANFRQMVQQVTGVPLGGGGGGPRAEPPLIRPDPQRAVPGRMVLPTLDTSSFLLDRAEIGSGLSGPAGAEAHLALDFEPLMSFPTLESWSVM